MKVTLQQRQNMLSMLVTRFTQQFIIKEFIKVLYLEAENAKTQNKANTSH